MYDLLVQRMGLNGTGYNIINKYRRTVNGGKCYLYLKNHFVTDSHDQKKSEIAEKDISTAFYIV